MRSIRRTNASGGKSANSAKKSSGNAKDMQLLVGLFANALNSKKKNANSSLNSNNSAKKNNDHLGMDFVFPFYVIVTSC